MVVIWSDYAKQDLKNILMNSKTKKQEKFLLF